MDGLTEREKKIVDYAIEKMALAMFAGRCRQTEDAYKDTMKRLEALPIIKERIEANKDRLCVMRKEKKLPGKSKSIVAFNPSGYRADPEEIFDAVLQDLEAHIQIDQMEVDELEKALSHFKNDPYFDTVSGRFIEEKTDYEISEALFCDESTVRRNRGRLIHKIAVMLYGVEAL